MHGFGCYLDCLNNLQIICKFPDIPKKSGNNANVKFYPDAPTEDITDHFRPAMKKKPYAIIVRTSTIDSTNDVNTIKHVRSIAKVTEKMKVGGDIQVGFPGIIERRNHDLGEKIKDINERLKRFYNSKGFLFVDNSNIDESSLNKSLLHLRRYGNRFFLRKSHKCFKGFLTY